MQSRQPPSLGVTKRSLTRTSTMDSQAAKAATSELMMVMDEAVIIPRTRSHIMSGHSEASSRSSIFSMTRGVFLSASGICTSTWRPTTIFLTTGSYNCLARAAS